MPRSLPLPAEGYVLFSKKNRIKLSKKEGVENRWEIIVESENTSTSPTAAQDQSDYSEAEVMQTICSKLSSLMNLQIRQAILSEHLLVLVGAGVSIGVGKTIKGLSMAALWEKAAVEVSGFQNIVERSNFPLPEQKNLERLLSHLQILKQVFDSTENNPAGNLDLDEAITNIKTTIVNYCNLQLPDERDTGHVNFLQKITNRRNGSGRTKIFTLNYDTLFEQAARRLETVVIDGFSFSHPRTFGGQYYDLDIVHRERSRMFNEENFLRHVFHLYKMHGSVDWKRNGNQIIQNDDAETDGHNPIMIFPANSKFEESYKYPFFEMMSRFQMELRKQNVNLLILGYSFHDAHVNRVIEEAIQLNANLHLIIVNNSIKEATGNVFENEAVDALRSRLFKWSEQTNRISLIGLPFQNFVDCMPEADSKTPEEKELQVFRKLINGSAH